MRRSIETKLNQYFFIESVNLKNNSKAKIVPRPPRFPRAALRRKTKENTNTRNVLIVSYKSGNLEKFLSKKFPTL
nr:MAG TPA: hypothetical protein [Caudoviricetes sp.]